MVTKIILDIDDNEQFGEVAFLLDREDVLMDIARARKGLGISKNIPWYDYNEWVNKNPNEELIFDDHKGNRAEIITFVSRRIAQKYKRPFYFHPLLRKAIACGEVRDEDMKRVVCQLIYAPIGLDYAPYHSDLLDYEPSIAIIVTPSRFIGKQMKEIKRAYTKALPQLLKEYSELSSDTEGFYYQDGKEVIIEPVTLKIPPDTITNIKRDREWFWQEKLGIDLKNIAKAAPERAGSDVIDFMETIRKAIEQYKENLASAI